MNIVSIAVIAEIIPAITLGSLKISSIRLLLIQIMSNGLGYDFVAEKSAGFFPP